MQAWLQSISMENVNDDIRYLNGRYLFCFGVKFPHVEKVFLSIFSAFGISVAGFIKLNGFFVVIRVKFNRRRV